MWNDCIFATSSVNSVFSLSDLCNAGNITRLIRQAKTTEIIDVIPNPVGTAGKIIYQLGEDTQFSIYIADILGNKVMTLEDGAGKSGKYEKFIDLSELNSGTYIVILKTATISESKLIEVSK